MRSFGRRALRWAAFLCLIAGLYWSGKQALIHPETPVPPEWNPFQPLRVEHPKTPLTTWKLGRTAEDPALCLAALAESGSSWRRLEDFVESEVCHIRPRVELASVGGVKIAKVETRCATALRLVMWARHGLQPAARTILGSPVAGIGHLSSYNCRPIRTSGGSSGRMSTHATADAIDITGFRLADGRSIRLIDDWEGDGPESRFLRAARDSACIWFKTALGPDFNALHADHFHLQSRGWGTCR